jgi:Ni,Fe-hydrogenase III large subunit
MGNFLHVYNGHAFEAAACPAVSLDDFRRQVTQAVAGGARLAALTTKRTADNQARLIAVLIGLEVEQLSVLSCPVGGSYPALTPDCPPAHWLEREIAEQTGIIPEGHPWLKPIRFSRWQAGAGPQIGTADFFTMQGSEVHEVAVGPVHAGVIEPGHFRFQCHGETVYHLEISLGYQHRGVENALVGGPDKRTRHYLETLAGDTTIGHALAWCRATEALSLTRVPLRAQAIRGIAAELERLANHIGDLGALAGDVGFLPTQSYCGRIRGDVLNITAELCGNRFGRGLMTPGGVVFDLNPEQAQDLERRLEAVAKDTRGAVELMFAAPSVLARLEGVGILSVEIARQIGLVGPAARACGLEIDARQDLPHSIYRFAHIPICTWTGGDCFARAYVRWLEVQHSLTFVREQLRGLPGGPISHPPQPLRPRQMVVAVTEGWRGEIVHLVSTGEDGRFDLYKIVDPSLHNWFGLAYALRGQQISDFPLCNKSFNLSYCGHDL